MNPRAQPVVPLPLVKLWLLGLTLTFADYLSTFYALEWSGKLLEESNFLARFSLELGGWRFLLIKDVFAFLGLGWLLLAYCRLNLGVSSTARLLAFSLLTVYAVARLGATVNNVVLGII